MSRSSVPRASSAASCFGSAPAIPACARRGCSATARRARRSATSHPHLALAFPDARVRALTRRGARRRRPGLRRASPRRIAANRAATSSTRGIPFVDLGADFRLDDAAAYERWYGEPHRAPELIERFVYGIPELNRAASPPPRAVAAAGCYPTAAILALKPLLGPDRSRHDHRRRRLGRQRRRQGAEGNQPFQQRRREYDRLRPARPPPHRRDGDGAGRQHPVHAASRADEPRHPRHLHRDGEGALRSAGGARARPMRTSPSSTSPSARLRPNGPWARTPSISPPATTSAPAGCSPSPRSTIW